MSSQTEEFTLGVEEEYQIINPTTGELCSRVQHILPKAEQSLGNQVQPEAQQSQIEIGTTVCRTLSDVRAELIHLRRQVIKAAALDGKQIAAAGTHPLSSWEDQNLTPKDRYQALLRDYQQLARELMIFGCHVHVGISNREIAIGIMNRARAWLSPLLALSSSSPFWLGTDTGYASYRTEIWTRWPISGPPLVFESQAEYDSLVNALIATESLEEATKIYWDIRPSERFPTLEFRITDVCMTIDEAVMIAGLVRGLARTCYQQVIADKPFVPVRPELIRAAHWRAARYGMDTKLVDVEQREALPAWELIDRFLNFLRPALEEEGDWHEVSELVEETKGRGTGATRQREAYKRRGDFKDVVDLIVTETAKGL